MLEEIEEVEYKCFIDSIQIRVNNLRLESFIGEYYHKPYIEDYALVYKCKKTNEVILNVRTAKDKKRDDNYQLISFNGFKKYKDRDEILLYEFKRVMQILKNNDIQYYLNKIDLAIDFYNINLTDLINTQRIKGQGVRRQLLSDATVETLEDVIKNIITFYFEAPTKTKTRVQRGYIYNKFSKENLSPFNGIHSIYRVEIELVNFNGVKDIYEKGIKPIELALLSNEFDRRRNIIPTNTEALEVSKQKYKDDYNVLLLEEIKKRFNKYHIMCRDTTVTFNFAIVIPIVELCNNL